MFVPLMLSVRGSMERGISIYRCKDPRYFEREWAAHRDLGRRLGWISMPDWGFFLSVLESLHLLPTLFCWLLSSSCVH